MSMLEVADIIISNTGTFSTIERKRQVRRYCPYMQGPCVAHCAFFLSEDRGAFFQPYEHRCHVVLACGNCEPVEYVAVHITDDRMTMEQELASVKDLNCKGTKDDPNR